MTTTTPFLQSEDHPERSGWRWSWLLWTLPLLLALGLLAFVTFQPVQVLPRITLAPGYALTDARGELLTSEDMRGKVALYNVTYTRCGERCAPSLAAMQAVRDRLDELPQSEIPIEFVTISVDPAHDSTAVLQTYSQQLGADPDRWHVVTGTPERLKWVVGGGFGLYFERRDDGTIKLDPGAMLVDGSGILRAEYRTATPDVEIILRDLKLLLEEAENNKGAWRYAYEAAHLFSCYPR